jgi:hypothetical protein
LLRKRLLRTALAYYQEFLEERRDDPAARAEPLDTTRRVEKSLADLAVLRAATHFYLLCQPVVLDDLRLTPDQRLRMKELTGRMGTEWMESFRDIGLVSPVRVRGIDFLGDDWDRYKGHYQPQREATKQEVLRVIDFAKLVNLATDDEFKKQIDSFIDVDAFLCFTAANAITSNLESVFALDLIAYLQSLQ